MPGLWRTQTTTLSTIVVEACWRPMEGDVAGDFYDVIDLRDGRVVVAAGDAPGFGPAAAALADELRSRMRDAFRETGEVREVLRRLDAHLAGTDEELVATAACAVVDPASRSVEVASAGHLPVVFADHTDARFLDCSLDPPLGVGGERHVARHPLPAEGALFLYTDGLVERRGMSLQDTLVKLLDCCRGLSGAAAWASELARRATELLGDPADDVTVVSVQLLPDAADHASTKGKVTANGDRPRPPVDRPAVHLQVFVDPTDLRSARTEALVRDLAYRLEGLIDLTIEVVDVTGPDADTETHGVLAAPTIVRVSPPPAVRVIGGLRTVADLARDLQLPLPTEEPDAH